MCVCMCVVCVVAFGVCVVWYIVCMCGVFVYVCLGCVWYGICVRIVVCVCMHV